ncbi:E3 ubiquitin-protein ligase DCST1 isoform X2 [Paralichthys olivaceus]|uniref:E3 ubiquitin-protein ligase DCST1 isoform X2 n=1 Tax=Paralichthys olivaceus TaxID=8255 RepID=UPI0037525CA5
MTQTNLQRRSAPHSTVEKLSLSFLPPAVHHFLFSQSEEWLVSHLVLRALFGAVSGSVLFLGISHGLPLTFDLKLAAGSVFVGVCFICGMLSSSFRCSVLLMFPSMLGSRGRTYMMVFILSVLYTGPVSNVVHNVHSAALSLSCNLDLQVHHSKLLWRHAIRPFTVITQQLVDDKAAFESEALSVSRKFQIIRDEVIAQYGYDQFKPQRMEFDRKTQEQFTTKTMMQCNSVVNEGVQRCSDWFKLRWVECMEAIPVPVISHILCVSMKFHFLCDIMRVMSPWCKQHVPVEGNFGRLFDHLNVSVDMLSREFSTELVVQERQAVLGGALTDHFTQSVRESLHRLTTVMKQLLDVMQLLLSFTFISVFIKAFRYLRQYRRDVHFDNVYITTYFRQIDTRRRRAGKCFLLPLRKSEKKKFIDPLSLRIHPDEFQEVMSGVFQLLSVSLLCVVLLTVDFSVVHALDIVSRHTSTQFNLTSRHQVDIRVGGASMMACLLRKTVSAFNSSSDFHIHTDNLRCVSPPSPLSAGVYVSCVCCVLLVALFTCLQVYTNRLRRVIAAFYHSKKEKKRVLYVYNLQLQCRISSQNSEHISSSEEVCQYLSRCGRHLCCRRREDSEMHYDPC